MVFWYDNKHFALLSYYRHHKDVFEKKVKKTKRVQKGPKMKKKMIPAYTTKWHLWNSLWEVLFRFGSNQNKFQKIPTLIQMYPKHVRKMGFRNRTRNFGISNALILAKIKFQNFFRRRRAYLEDTRDWYKKDFLTPFCLYLGMTRP